jgi:phage terminase small subunit
MPALKNPTHESFAQAVASGKHRSSTAAYMAVRPGVGLATARVKACVLMKSAVVRARIAEIDGRNDLQQERITERAAEKLAERLAEKIAVTREFVIEQLLDNLKRAKSGEKFDGGTANRAAELLGKEIGMFVDRSENLNTTFGISDKPMSPEAWTAKYADTPESEEQPVKHDSSKKLH